MIGAAAHEGTAAKHVSRRRLPPPLQRTDALFLDIDGTLLELAPTPDRVDIDPALRSTLAATARSLGGALALITGRSIRSADSLFPGLALPIAGQHGCERRGADGAMHLHSSHPGTLDRLRDLVSAFATRHPGLLVEHKGASLAVHYRAVPELASLVHREIRHVVTEVDGWTAEGGKMLVEVRPGGPDKGRAIGEFLAEAPFAGRRPVFVGDDRGDEPGFRIVERAGGIGVKVGAGRTYARHRLADVDAVRAWLAALAPPASA
ncbi:MAG: trehalose-phosphatase [Burkholderiales bacterium]|nr:trehalose-phosphatase [Burkholderiales bacterium]